MNILAFAGSNSRSSINKRLAGFVADHYWDNEQIRLPDLNDYPLPMFGVDLEAESGYPEKVFEFADHIDWADLIVLSLAEHNGAYTAVFKNLFDWLSRLPDRTVWMNKPLLLLSTSNGGRGARSVLEIAEKRFPHNGGEVIGTFSLPHFSKNFDDSEGITDARLKDELDLVVASVKMAIAEQ